MSTCASEMMINSHESRRWSRLTNGLRLWRQRWHQRHELAQWTERELHDVGLSWSDVVREAEKPFWRA